MGRSGCGKSTLLRLLAGLERPWSGQVIATPASAQMSLLSQNAVFFEHLSVVDNARYFERIRAVRGRFDSVTFSKLAKQLELGRILEVRKPVTALSGGERQRLALLRALSIRPEILFLDEPCSGLDVMVKEEFLMHLRVAVESQGLLAVYVTHHADEARLVADEIVYLRRPEGAPITHAWQGDLPAFLAAPPHISVAELLLGPTFNCIPCTVDGDN